MKSEFTRRDFLKVAIAGAVAPFLGRGPEGEPSPVEPTGEYTDAEWITIKQPIKTVVDTLGRRWDMGISPVRVLDVRHLEGEIIDSSQPLIRRFPSYPLTAVRENFRLPGHSETAVPDIAVFSHPQLDSGYLIVVQARLAKRNPQTGELEAGKIDATNPVEHKMFLDAGDILELSRGILGQYWEVETVEEFDGYRVHVDWVVGRALPYLENYVEKPISVADSPIVHLTSIAQRWNSIFSIDSQKPDEGFEISINSPTGLLCIPVTVDYQNVIPQPPHEQQA